MLKSFRYRLLPTQSQEVLISKHIGCVRFVYNLALEAKQAAYRIGKLNLSAFDLMKQLTDLKKDCIWLKQVNAQSLQHSIKRLDSAFANFFAKRSDIPKFKNKYSPQVFNVPQAIRIEGNKLIIPKFKEGIEVIIHRPVYGLIKNATITRSRTGKYFVSILCDTNDVSGVKPKIDNSNTVGIDLGIKWFLVTSDGGLTNNPKFLDRTLSRMRFVESRASRYNGKKYKKLTALLHEKVANQRKDFLHKLSTKLIRENQSIAIEDLNVKGMIQNRRLSKAIWDAGWGTFVNLLEYKADWYGRNLLRIGRFEPSSKTCSGCGTLNNELKLQDRVWTCGSCGCVLDRDVNAAINIKNFALKNYLSVERRLENRNELPEISGVLTSEALLG